MTKKKTKTIAKSKKVQVSTDLKVYLFLSLILLFLSLLYFKKQNLQDNVYQLFGAPDTTVQVMATAPKAKPAVQKTTTSPRVMLKK